MVNSPYTLYYLDFPGSSAGKESTCNAGDPGSIPGLEDPLEEGMATHSSILAWRSPMDRGAWQATAHGVAKSQTQLRFSSSVIYKVLEEKTYWFTELMESRYVNQHSRFIAVVAILNY